MQTWEAIAARRNVREFSARPVLPAELDRILEAGRRAPSANNRQHRDFVLCTERDQLQALAQNWQWGRHVAGSAATVVVVVPVPATSRDAELDMFDAGQAVMAMMLAAADLGIGSGHASVGDQAQLRRLLGVPESHQGVCMVALGYPAGQPLAPLKKVDRRPFAEVVHRGKW